MFRVRDLVNTTTTPRPPIAAPCCCRCRGGAGTCPAAAPLLKTRRLRPRPAGSPEAPFRNRSLGQSAAWAALAGHIGLVFHIAPHPRRALAAEEVGALLAEHDEARAAPRRGGRAVGVALRPRVRLQVEHPQIVESSIVHVNPAEDPSVPAVRVRGMG
eukprot:scaffold9064_cov48-Phaeocystis_antarctica.AAC.2